ncbi:MAG: hypothetical protein WC968_04230 [Bacilli bacterium]
MGNHKLKSIMAIAGTILVLFPILFMLMTSLIGSIAEGYFLMDYMLPAELSVVIFIGFIFFIFSSWTSRSDTVLFVLMGAIALILFLIIIIFGGDFIFTMILLILFDIAVLALGIVGILYCRKLFK